MRTERVGAEDRGAADILAAAWDSEYRKPGLRDWELLPPTDMTEVLKEIPELNSIASAVELGCGRGMRALLALLNTPDLNRESFVFHGIDHSRTAIRQATSLLECVRSGQAIQEPFGALIGVTDARENARRINTVVTFRESDIFEWLPKQEAESIDLVIDWMCFHEIDERRWQSYAEQVVRTCRRFFLLKTFSREGSSVENLGKVAGVEKHQHSEQGLIKLFGEQFSIVSFKTFPEILDPTPKHSDGIVAAKRSYLFKKVKAPQRLVAPNRRDSIPNQSSSARFARK